MQIFSSSRKAEPTIPAIGSEKPAVTPKPSNRTAVTPQSSGILSSGVSINGSVKFRNELLIDGEVEGKIDSTGLLTIGEHAQIRGEIRAKSVKVRGKVEANI